MEKNIGEIQRRYQFQRIVREFISKRFGRLDYELPQKMNYLFIHKILKTNLDTSITFLYLFVREYNTVLLQMKATLKQKKQHIPLFFHVLFSQTVDCSGNFSTGLVCLLAVFKTIAIFQIVNHIYKDHRFFMAHPAIS